MDRLLVPKGAIMKYIYIVLGLIAYAGIVLWIAKAIKFGMGDDDICIGIRSKTDRRKYWKPKEGIK